MAVSCPALNYAEYLQQILKLNKEVGSFLVKLFWVNEAQF